MSNFKVKLNKKLIQEKTPEEANNILIRLFQKKWKLSGIARELKEKEAPVTRGQKARKKRYFGKRRKKS